MHAGSIAQGDAAAPRPWGDAVEAFAGCAVTLSHDRVFIDRLCTHILASEDEAYVEWFEASFEDYEEDRKRRLGPNAVEPQRLKHKKFAR